MLGILAGLKASWAARPAFAVPALSTDQAVTLPSILPAPVDAGPSGQSAGAPPRIGMTVGTSGDDRLAVQAGGMALGGGGNDVFVLSADLPGQAWRPMAFIPDYAQGDSLDLSRLGEQARVLDTLDLDDGRSRIGIDIDSDGYEDGYLIVGAARLPNAGDYQPMPMPEPRPWPVEPPNAFDPGWVVGPISSPPGEARILPVDGWIFH